VPGSAEAAQALGSHLAGLNEYLAERHPAVAAVTVAGHENGGVATGAQSESGAHSGAQSFTSQDSAGNSNLGNSSASDESSLGSPRSNPISTAGQGIAQPLPPNATFSSAQPATESSGSSSGNYISVMA
jgi:hypothetical protein